MVIILTLSSIFTVRFFTALPRLKPPSLASPQRRVGLLDVRLTGGGNEERRFLFPLKNGERNWMICRRR